MAVSGAGGGRMGTELQIRKMERVPETDSSDGRRTLTCSGMDGIPEDG